MHRAPTAGTAANASKLSAVVSGTNTAVTSSRYYGSAWTAQASTQMLLKSTTSGACLYCHVAEAPVKMFGGDMTLALAGESAFGWNEFYGHTTGCVSCHAVHGARTFKSADGTVDAKILKYQGVKNLGTVALKIQPEVYAGGGALYDSLADAQNGVLSTTAVAAGVTPLQGAVTAQCSICHASYAKDSAEVNANYLNAELFQPASWRNANGATTQIFVGNAANPVSVLPGVPGLTYTGGTPSAMTGLGRFAHHEVQEPPDEGRRRGVQRRRVPALTSRSASQHRRLQHRQRRVPELSQRADRARRGRLLRSVVPALHAWLLQVHGRPEPGSLRYSCNRS